MINEALNTEGLDVGFLKLNFTKAEMPTELESHAYEVLQQKGLKIVPPFLAEKPEIVRSRLRIITSPEITDFYPSNHHSKDAIAHASAFEPDAVLILWSEVATALFSEMKCRKYAYYGNPDSKSFLANARNDLENGGSLKTYLLALFRARQLKSFNIETLSKYSHIGNVAANDALFYRKNGLDRVEYIQNIWVDRFRDRPPALPNIETKNDEHTNIIANVGKLSGTANRYGLEYFAKQVLPCLEAAMPTQFWTAHVLGSGKLSPTTADAFSRSPHIAVRGFVDDIDDEMSKSGIFVCVNNGTRYNVGHTRYLHAWSLGCCVIAHSAVREAMPEFIHGKNALLGSSGQEIAKLIAQAAGDPDLRRQIGAGGYETFREEFTATSVFRKILASVSAHHHSVLVG